MSTGEYVRTPAGHGLANTSRSVATFERDGDSVKLRDDASGTAAMAQCYFTGKELRAKVDDFMREAVGHRLNDLNADDLIAKEIGRRVEVAVKTAIPRIEREVEAAAKAAVIERVRAAVAALGIDVAVQIKEAQ